MSGRHKKEPEKPTYQGLWKKQGASLLDIWQGGTTLDAGMLQQLWNGSLLPASQAQIALQEYNARFGTSYTLNKIDIPTLEAYGVEEDVSMLFAVDIDGTIAGRNMRQFAHACNQAFNLKIAPDILESSRYREFMQHPAMKAYQEQVGERRFQREIGWIDLTAEALLAKPALPGAIDGIRQLATLATVVYYTARYSSVWPEKSKMMADATKQWLRAQQFPNPDTVVFCEDIKDKLIKLAEYSRVEAEQIVLIDDHPRLFEAVGKLDQEIRSMLQRHLTIVHFRTEQIPDECYEMQVIPLVSWQNLHILLDYLESRKGVHAC